MLQTKFARLGAFAVGVTFAFGVFAAPASAQTIAELQAQINALMAQLASLQGGSTTSNTTGYNFTMNLTVGSTGGDVTSLQQFLVGGGYLNMPAGVSYGYFGPLTRSAVAAWQAANGITPAVGYFGPISRARANTMGGGTVTPGTPTTPGAGITTPGVEGTITVSLNPTPASGTKVYEGDSRVAALGIKLEAKLSDIRVERVKVQIPDVTFYTKIASRIYVMDGSTVLASSDLNSSTVVNESGTRSITLSGMNFVVPKDSTRVLTVALDIHNTIDSQYTDGDTFTISIPVNGVRGMDGAAINQFGPGTLFSRTITPTAALADSQTLTVSNNSNTPAASEVIAAAGTDEDELDGLELLRFDLRSTRAAATVTDAVVTITRGGAQTATSSVAYLYDGSTLVGSASVVGTSASAMTATFSDIDYVVPADTTRTLTVKVDIDDATATATTFVASVAASTGLTVEKHDGTTLSETGSATGQSISVLNVGPEITLSSKSIAKDVGTSGLANGTSTASATFNLNIKAVGGDLWFGTQSASSTFAFGIHAGGADAAVVLAASSTSWAVPSGADTSDNATGQAFKLAEGSSVSIPVTFLFEGRLASGANLSINSYAVGLSSVAWSDSKLGPAHSSTFMANKTEWRTSGVTMP